MADETIKVEGMTCGGCKASVEQALTSVAGVSGVQVSLEYGHVQVTYDEQTTSKHTLEEEIEDAGFDVVKP
ncbi:copper chaperone [Salsuginibacillus halophilus]|uniref:Copper chaperone CopZ n=1 Tax=Salsuginibacillus halophilus TaxID=517424 RepID=A0A2P8HYL1_9BACI|nr:cation transporter [Salsuginibacillus halophilus]PSL51310.1 copper chaperone [Salsuginibacillus halophilus]